MASRPGLCDYNTTEGPVKHRPHQGDPELSPGATCLGHADGVRWEGHVMRGQGADQDTQTPAPHLVPLIIAVPGAALPGGRDPSRLFTSPLNPNCPCPALNCCRGVPGFCWVSRGGSLGGRGSQGPSPPGRRRTPPCTFLPGPQRQIRVAVPCENCGCGSGSQSSGALGAKGGSSIEYVLQGTESKY